jgi:hypothetical protein
MKHILIILLAAITLQGCLKIEDDASACNSTLPDTPQIVTNGGVASYYVSVGSTAYLRVYNPLTPDYLYIWNGPNNFIDTGSTVSFLVNDQKQEGDYTVTVVEKGYSSKCASPPSSVHMYVDLTLPSCGMPNNSFKPGSNYSSVYSTYNGDGNDHTDYYTAYWSVGFSTLNVYFKQVPPLGTHYYPLTSTTYVENIAADKAEVYFNNGGDVYDSKTGGLYTINDGSTCQVLFCNATFTYNSQTLSGGAGNLRFNL